MSLMNIPFKCSLFVVLFKIFALITIVEKLNLSLPKNIDLKDKGRYLIHTGDSR